MSAPESTAEIRARAIAWLREDPDEATRLELQELLDRDDRAQLAERFSSRLDFGTAGLRGVLGAGPHRMNRATVIRATAALCTHLLATVSDAAARGVVIGFDARRMSRRFAEDVAEVCAGLGICARLFKDIVPTPLLAFAVKDVGAAAGVMITASHNPPEYNGYKAYWSNGAQIIPPHDAAIVAAMDAIADLVTVARPILKEARAKELVVDVPDATELRYLDAVGALTRHPGSGSQLAIVYTPLHGVGDRLAHVALQRAGFSNVFSVPEQAVPDSTFPTTPFPNPEERGALDLALALARSRDADLVVANDPDADRLAVATRETSGAWRQLTGDEIGVLFAYYLLVDDPTPAPQRLVVTTVVSSRLLAEMSARIGVRCDTVLTGFKWIANRAIDVERETGAAFVFGYEEALGFTVGTVTRDKDGISAAAVFAELTAFYLARGRSLTAQLEHIHREFGLHITTQRSATYHGIDGVAAIDRIMESVRADPPAALAGVPLSTMTDLRTGECRQVADGTVTRTTLPASNVIAFDLVDGSRVTLRPSGTEPKIKFYFDVREVVRADEPINDARVRASTRLDAHVSALAALVEQLATSNKGGGAA